MYVHVDHFDYISSPFSAIYSTSYDSADNTDVDDDYYVVFNLTKAISKMLACDKKYNRPAFPPLDTDDVPAKSNMFEMYVDEVISRYTHDVGVAINSDVQIVLEQNATEHHVDYKVTVRNLLNDSIINSCVFTSQHVYTFQSTPIEQELAKAVAAICKVVRWTRCTWRAPPFTTTVKFGYKLTHCVPFTVLPKHTKLEDDLCKRLTSVLYVND